LKVESSILYTYLSYTVNCYYASNLIALHKFCSVTRFKPCENSRLKVERSIFHVLAIHSKRRMEQKIAIYHRSYPCPL